MTEVEKQRQGRGKRKREGNRRLPDMMPFPTQTEDLLPGKKNASAQVEGKSLD